MAARILTIGRKAAEAAGPAPVEQGLPPVVAGNTRVLILGSFPGRASLAARQYYGNARNHFWPLMAAVTGEPLVELNYPARLERMLARGLGLWDTIVACQRAGSLDADIRNAIHGEFELVAQRAPEIALVCFNGQRAGRAARAWQDAGYATCVMPSTSPAHTRPFAEKLAAWQAISEVLQ
jgi:hypoxanthine-DNA glycosylase